MHDLYNGVMILGRSLTDIKTWGWACGTLGERSKGPKCVNGILTVSAGASVPVYIGQMPGSREPLRLAAVALLQTAPADIVKRILDAAATDYKGEDAEDIKPFLHALKHPEHCANMDTLGSVLARINDDANEDGDTLDKWTAAAWFERALDKLAEQLPDPLPRAKTYTEIVEEAVAAIDRERHLIPA
mgnify:CR=1 FL=1